MIKSKDTYPDRVIYISIIAICMFKIVEKGYTADVAADITAETAEELFAESAQALTSIMCSTKDVAPILTRKLHLEARPLDMLLYEFLEELLFLKDAEQFLASSFSIKIEKITHKEKSEKEKTEKEKAGNDIELFDLTAKISGECINPEKHKTKIDVKAVTLHDFKVEKNDKGYFAHIVFDI